MKVAGPQHACVVVVVSEQPVPWQLGARASRWLKVTWRRGMGCVPRAVTPTRTRLGTSLHAMRTHPRPAYSQGVAGLLQAGSHSLGLRDGLGHSLAIAGGFSSSLGLCNVARGVGSGEPGEGAGPHTA